jgi:hypothetical protein
MRTCSITVYSFSIWLAEYIFLIKCLLFILYFPYNKTMSDIKEGMEDAGDKMKKGAKKTGDKMEEGAQETKEKVD